MKYQTHYNLGRAFEVEFKGKHFTIHRLNYIEDEERYVPGKKIKSGTCLKYWIGKSPKNKMTERSGGYGKNFDGNTILIHLSKFKYMQIGSIVCEFTLREPVLEYISPVGNDDVPYPYAVLEDGFLLCSQQIKKSKKKGRSRSRSRKKRRKVKKVKMYLPYIKGYPSDPYQIFYGHVQIHEVPVKILAFASDLRFRYEL